MNGLDYDIRGLARRAIIALYITAIAEVALMALSVMTLQYYTALEDGRQIPAYLGVESGLFDTITAVIAFGYLIVYFICVVICAFWIYRAASNAEKIMPSDERITAGWSVGWYFVPFMNLWKPFQGMKHIWNSRAGGADLNSPLPSNASWWWGCWVASNILGNLQFRLSSNDNISNLINSEYVGLVASPFSIVAAILFAGLIREVTDMQEQNAGVASVFE
ncbi:DUF4328 domain-containing protein [Amylibacter sp. IMCC11727]|uniref:DUF4328 domain-containing protein n=1 Tax=Amylibacter sp. IMCC11727 TaxID=3039851 RepID=UPI00244DAB6C|nr:DUF4328 domain-containing protein [Amylibacter sp. IMCC11727]WGI22153.1 DUF4328 domain-containing protein [Amylibacter sp. IMCC11727]